MDKKKMDVIKIICFATLWLICVVLGYTSSHKRGVYYEKYIEEVYGNIQFKGKVLQLHKIKRGGRTYGLMCIELDYTNTDSFYRFESKAGGAFGSEYRMSCLKIKDGIVTFPTGFIGTDYSIKIVNAIVNAKYIEVNMDNSRQIVYIDSVGNRYSADFGFPSNNIIESDMEICN